MIDVVSGVLVRDGRVLLTQRCADDVFPLFWECPGGKVEPGESLRRALVRELLEEIMFDDDHALDLAPFFVTEFPDGFNTGERVVPAVRVHFFCVRVAADFTPKLREVAGAGWFRREEIRQLELLPSCDRLFFDQQALRSMRLVDRSG